MKKIKIKKNRCKTVAGASHSENKMRQAGIAFPFRNLVHGVLWMFAVHENDR
jgi:hypothetical protein